MVLDSDSDLRSSEGLALIDDVSRFLARQRRLLEVRSATQPLGSTAPLDPARLSERLGAVNAGYARMESGSRQLQDGLTEGAAKLRAALWIEGRIGDAADRRRRSKTRRASRESEAGGGQPASPAGLSAWPAGTQTPEAADTVRGEPTRAKSCSTKLTRAAAGAGQLAAGAAQARREVASILEDPVGRRGAGPAPDHAGNCPRTSRAAARASPPTSRRTAGAAGST